jgi:hypothetical protein
MENNKTGALYALCASVVKRLIAQVQTIWTVRNEEVANHAAASNQTKNGYKPDNAD